MFIDDTILREISNMTRVIANAVLQKGAFIQAADEEEIFSESAFLYHRLTKMLLDKNINGAENLLTAELERRPTQGNLQVAVQFYRDLQDMDDDCLAEADFSREEIREGLAYIRRLYL